LQGISKPNVHGEDSKVPKYLALMEQRWAEIVEGTRQVDHAAWSGDHAQAVAAKRRVAEAQEALGRQLVETGGLFTWVFR
jgi:hypothetical protein